MNKILIAVGIIVSAYLIYSSMNSNDNNAKDTIETSTPESQTESVSSPQQVEEIVEDVYDNKRKTLDGRYVLNISTETTETSQVFDFSTNGSFTLSRKMISPDPSLAGTVIGTYTIKGNTIHLSFPAERDKKTFSVDTAGMTIKSESEIEYGGFIAFLY